MCKVPYASAVESLICYDVYKHDKICIWEIETDAERHGDTNNSSYLIIQVHKDMFPTTEQFNMQHLEALKNIRL